MYQLGNKSLEKLKLVHPDLARVVKRAINLTEQDFTVVEGLRTLERQKELVATGKSQTMKSRHLDGHAVDLAPWVNGTIDWNTTSHFDAVAEAMRKAAIAEKVEVLWGASWDLALNYRVSSADALEAYLHDCKVKGKKPFLDRPHFQLTWKAYP
jgi:peptidoglycan L-alanyl-D-glutamate endopeptidase CwlK